MRVIIAGVSIPSKRGNGPDQYSALMHQGTMAKSQSPRSGAMVLTRMPVYHQQTYNQSQSPRSGAMVLTNKFLGRHGKAGTVVSIPSKRGNGPDRGIARQARRGTVGLNPLEAGQWS